MNRAHQQRRFKQFQAVVQRSMRFFRTALRVPQSALQTAAGHAVPTRRELSERRVTLTDTAEAGAALRAARPNTNPARPFFSSGPCAKPPGWNPTLLSERA